MSLSVISKVNKDFSFFTPIYKSYFDSWIGVNFTPVFQIQIRSNAYSILGVISTPEGVVFTPIVVYSTIGVKILE
jgi:hypothetical protein